MTLVELASLVHDMREAQNRYFKTRSSGALSESKDLERQTDKAVKQILNPQPSLFGDQ